MRRKTETLLAALIVGSMAIVGVAVALPAFAHQQAPTYNVAQVYITSWSLDSEPNETTEVQFRISLDFNGDGVFEVSRSSDVFTDTQIEIAPFRLGGPVDTTVTSFTFKVEVFRIVNGVAEPFGYTTNGSVPVNVGTNIVDSAQAWDYNSSADDLTDGASCNIAYAYYVS